MSTHLTMDLRDDDMYIYHEIFEQRVYAGKIPVKLKAPNILDLGANVGCSALYFMREYPDANIFCVEPDEQNFSILKNNIRDKPKIKAVRFAVHPRYEMLELYSPEWDNRPCAYRTKVAPAGKGTVFGMPIASIIAMSRFSMVDVLKIDIEGAEDELFLGKNGLNWLGRVRYLIAEIHGTTKKEIMEALRLKGFEVGFHEDTRLLTGYHPGRI